MSFLSHYTQPPPPPSEHHRLAYGCLMMLGIFAVSIVAGAVILVGTGWLVSLGPPSEETRVWIVMGLMALCVWFGFAAGRSKRE